MIPLIRAHVSPGEAIRAEGHTVIAGGLRVSAAPAELQRLATAFAAAAESADYSRPRPQGRRVHAKSRGSRYFTPENLADTKATPGVWVLICDYATRWGVQRRALDINAGMYGDGYTTRIQPDDGVWQLWVKYEVTS